MRAPFGSSRASLAAHFVMSAAGHVTQQMNMRSSEPSHPKQPTRRGRRQTGRRSAARPVWRVERLEQHSLSARQSASPAPTPPYEGPAISIPIHDSNGHKKRRRDDAARHTRTKVDKCAAAFTGEASSRALAMALNGTSPYVKSESSVRRSRPRRVASFALSLYAVAICKSAKQ